MLDIPADGRWTEALREAYADRVEGILAQHIPGFRDTVLARRCYSPADLMNYARLLKELMRRGYRNRTAIVFEKEG